MAAVTRFELAGVRAPLITQGAGSSVEVAEKVIAVDAGKVPEPFDESVGVALGSPTAGLLGDQA